MPDVIGRAKPVDVVEEWKVAEGAGGSLEET